jgi:selenocysteine lyase/cysteine desulfurase
VPTTSATTATRHPHTVHTGTSGAASGDPSGLTLVGAGALVPLVTGERVPYVNLDHAASAPCLTRVRDAVDDVLPWYASVHRGAGYLSQVSTRRYERARETVLDFLGAPPGSACVFTRNTTDAMNLLAHALPRGTTVLVFETEHHASLLPWRGRRVVRLPAPDSPVDVLTALDDALRACPVGPRLVCVSGASNVTGEVWPVAQVVGVAREHGARVALDAAQLAPHRPVDVRALGVDYVAVSGHKLYAPFGAGALVGRADWLRAAEPYLVGGGATRRVFDDGVAWNGLPERHEAGTPNLPGAVALARREEDLLDHLRAGLAAVPGVAELGLWGPRHPRVGIVSFTVDGWEPALLSAALAAEHGIGVRAGAFCAHPFVRRLTDRVGQAGRGAVRASIGLGTTRADLDRFLAALRQLVQDGPRWTYVERGGELVPEPDPRPWPWPPAEPAR